VTRQQRTIVLTFVFVLLVIGVGYSLLPFTFANTIHCSPPLFGAKPKEKTAPVTGFIRPVEDCLSAGKSRGALAATTALIAVAAGTAMVALKPISQRCLSGDHGNCHSYWPGFIGGIGEDFSCQCTCHSRSYSYSYAPP
jgi:hypothetical protein